MKTNKICINVETMKLSKPDESEVRLTLLQLKNDLRAAARFINKNTSIPRLLDAQDNTNRAFRDFLESLHYLNKDQVSYIHNLKASKKSVN